VDSVPTATAGVAATVTVTGDVVRGDASGPGAKAAAGGSDPAAGTAADARSSRHILLVEDHADTRRVMVRLLHNFGCTVTTAATVAEATDLAAREQFDLLISDIGLPDGSGADVITKIRATKPIPGIALSGFGQPEDLARSHRAGFQQHLTKPIDVARLRAAIEQLTR
jgi:CheY-like chemotaxis protein